jgi:hypothetical protein
LFVKKLTSIDGSKYIELKKVFLYFPQEKNEVDDANKASETVCALK